MTRRDLIIVALLTIITCGIYALYWLYVTTDELKRVSGRNDLNPGIDVLLTVVTCGIFGLYVEYRNAQIVHATMQRMGRPHDDKSTLVLILNVLVFVTGITGLAATLVLQDDFNNLADVTNAMRPPA